MQSWEELEEIEALGEEDPWEPPPPKNAGESLSTVPLLQALLCVLLLAGLLYLRESGRPAYEEIKEIYRREAAQEWRLPERPAGVSPSPSPGPTLSPTPAALPGPQAQRL